MTDERPPLLTIIEDSLSKADTIVLMSIMFLITREVLKRQMDMAEMEGNL